MRRKRNFVRSLQPRVRKRFCRLPVQLFLGIRRANTQCRQRRRGSFSGLSIAFFPNANPKGTAAAFGMSAEKKRVMLTQM